jgi:predicted nucleic acid-binding protein
MRDWVFIDTCIWASHFSKRGSLESRSVDELLDLDRVAIVGPILAEVLIGFRRKDEADWIASRLKGAHYVETDWNYWRSAADLGRELAAQGHHLPLSDMLLAAVVLRSDSWVYSTDPHFDVIPGLKRYWPTQD